MTGYSVRVVKIWSKRAAALPSGTSAPILDASAASFFIYMREACEIFDIFACTKCAPANWQMFADISKPGADRSYVVLLGHANDPKASRRT